ncbi:MAG: hypothetical protein H0T92_08255 [Pyrinomonadaceae bacterium]|nr:hypothetical protein [Pyrinomonadaceae bacterium]
MKLLRVFQCSIQICLLAVVFGVTFVCGAVGQRVQTKQEREFGPVVRTYLGYLRAEQEVVDDRASRREISPSYYRRNSNRIRALRRTAIRIARESRDDYLPELEAVTRDEFDNLFESPPSIESLQVGQVLNNAYKFLNLVRSGETFYVFTRLNPDEQAELINKKDAAGTNAVKPSTATAQPRDAVRPRKTQVP